MSKFLHADAGHQTGESAARLGIEWPAIPWQCPGCDQIFTHHAATVATLDASRYEFPREATFRCMLCDLLAHVGTRETDTVHILDGGLPLCGFSDLVPGKWPPGHRWISIADWLPAYRQPNDCPRCWDAATYDRVHASEKKGS